MQLRYCSHRPWVAFSKFWSQVSTIRSSQTANNIYIWFGLPKYIGFLHKFKCKNSEQACKRISKQWTNKVSFLHLIVLCVTHNYPKTANMTRTYLQLHTVKFSNQLGWLLKFHHWNKVLRFLQLIFIHKQRRAQWVYERTIVKSNKFLEIPVPIRDFSETNASKSVCPDWMGARFATIFSWLTTW